MLMGHAVVLIGRTGVLLRQHAVLGGLTVVLMGHTAGADRAHA